MTNILTLPVVVPAILKGLLLLALAALVILVLHRRFSAGARHLLWLSAIAGLLILPALSTLLPAWRVVPGWPGNEAAGKDSPATEFVLVSRPLATPPKLVDRVPGEPAGVEETRVEKSHAWHPLTVAWLLGIVALAGRLLLSRGLLGRAFRKGTPVTEGSLFTEIEAIRRSAGIRRRIRIRLADASASGAMPMTWGILRPVLLLPAEIGSWEPGRREVVLLHEIAHIRRWDAATHLFVQAVCALHWFNPLAWFAARQVHIERERACDDFVLRNGSVKPSEYAGHLLRILSNFASFPQARTAACAMAMAAPGKSHLERRLSTITADTVDRRPVSLGKFALIVAACGLLMTPIAMLEAQQEEKRNEPEAELSGAASGLPGTLGDIEARNPVDEIVIDELTGKEISNLVEWVDAGIAHGDFDGDGELDLFVADAAALQSIEAETFVGIGVRIDDSSEEGGGFRITELIDGGPAAGSGNLAAGDRIVGVAQGAGGKMIDVRELDSLSLVKLIRGEPGTEVRLKLVRAEQPEHEVSLQRAEIAIHEPLKVTWEIEDFYQHAFEAQTAIGALRKELKDDLATLETEISEKLAKLAERKKRYMEDHPQVKSLQSEVNRLRAAQCANCHDQFADLKIYIKRGDGTFEELKLPFARFWELHQSRVDPHRPIEEIPGVDSPGPAEREKPEN